MRLTKHHGLGNDFLVLLDRDGTHPLDADVARALCDRHTGVGADGVIRATPRPGSDPAAASGAVAVMELFNADGSRPETSGNGIRCLAQALVDDGWTTGPSIPIATDAGLRTVTLHEPVDQTTLTLSVDMGPARLRGDAPEWAGGAVRRAARVDTGNPHLVCELVANASAADVDLVGLGEQVNSKEPGGANVHLLTVEGDNIAIRTYERGVGLTRSCGTGACAAAVAAHAWGLVGDMVVVEQQGGRAEVTLGDTVVLRGPATLVGTVDLRGAWPWR